MARRNSARRSATTRPKACPRRIDTLQGWTRVLAEADGCAPCDDTDCGAPLAREVTLQQEHNTMTPATSGLAPPASEPAAALVLAGYGHAGPPHSRLGVPHRLGVCLAILQPCAAWAAGAGHSQRIFFRLRPVGVSALGLAARACPPGHDLADLVSAEASRVCVE